MLPSQQPEAQVVELQAAMQAPLEQANPIAQDVQLAPAEPQAVSALPARQAPALVLHPVVQGTAPQAAI